MRLNEIKDIFANILPGHVHHYTSSEEPDNYIVWAEDSTAEEIISDNKHKIMTLQGTVDYYTREEYDPVIEKINTALNNSGMSWKLNSIQFEKETGYIHYEWIWEAAKKIG